MAANIAASTMDNMAVSLVGNLAENILDAEATPIRRLPKTYATISSIPRSILASVENYLTRRPVPMI